MTRIQPVFLPSAAAAARCRLRAFAAAAAACLAACGGGGDAGSGGGAAPSSAATGTAAAPASTAAAPSVERTLSPLAADPAARAAAGALHVAVNPDPRVAAARKLFVFLPGTGGVPDQYRLILRAGAARGFHAIGLDYPNDTAVGVLCAGSTDADCFWNVRREIITGQNLSPLVDVGAADAVVTRLTRALEQLQRLYPDEGWGQYLGRSGPDWSRIAVGGHSQGGGHAGVMTRLYALGRACYFASPPDWDLRLNRPADWMARSALTPAAAQFGFSGLSDPSVPYAQLALNWQTLGLAAFGPAVSVDTTVAPFSGAHMLTTDAAPNPSNAAGQPLHGLTVRDAFTPRNASGAPVFDAAWGHLCFS